MLIAFIFDIFYFIEILQNLQQIFLCVICGVPEPRNRAKHRTKGEKKPPIVRVA